MGFGTFPSFDSVANRQREKRLQDSLTAVEDISASSTSW